MARRQHTGGPGGGSRPKDGQSKAKKPTPLQRRARRDVGLSVQPAIQSIDREQALARDAYERATRAATGAYGTYQTQLGAVPQLDVAPIGGWLQEQLGNLSGLLGLEPPAAGIPAGLPESEQTAGAGLFGTLGASGFESLASQAARNQTYQASAGREGALAERWSLMNLLRDFQDALQGFSGQRMDVTGQMPALVRQRTDELRDQAQSRASDKALSDYLMGVIGGQVGGGGGGGGGGRPGPSGRPTGPRTGPASTPQTGGGYWTGEPTGQNAGPVGRGVPSAALPTPVYTPPQMMEPQGQVYDPISQAAIDWAQAMGMNPPKKTPYEEWLMQYDPYGYQMGLYPGFPSGV